ncbi:hypothetical protein EYF80_066011 [Liparis tanakae]|uniref:Uncharacterized protein n=1 Tax=Liparis tanakae TaxID=230148 RepID=A0A4Z2E576_9TELE|nr:hypothetical protein EYF80_066011 [Liparis tanakae]
MEANGPGCVPPRPQLRKQSVWLGFLRGSGWRGDLPNEQTCLGLDIMLPHTDGSMGTTGYVLLESGMWLIANLQDRRLQVTMTTDGKLQL